MSRCNRNNAEGIWFRSAHSVNSSVRSSTSSERPRAVEYNRFAVNTMAKKKRASRDDIAECFEDSLAELEAIVSQLEGGTLSLAEALVRYEQGVKHLSACQRMLDRAERRIELLSGVDANGNPVTRPFDDSEAASLEEKAASRGQRRSAGAKPPTGKAGNFDENMDDLPTLF